MKKIHFRVCLRDNGGSSYVQAEIRSLSYGTLFPLLDDSSIEVEPSNWYSNEPNESQPSSENGSDSETDFHFDVSLQGFKFLCS